MGNLWQHGILPYKAPASLKLFVQPGTHYIASTHGLSSVDGGLCLEASGGGEAARPLPGDDVEDVLLVGWQGRVHLGLHLGLAPVDAAAVPVKTPWCQP